MEDIFKNKKPILKKLGKFGFVKNSDNYVYSTNILDNEFKLTVSISFDGIVETKLIELETNEIYTLHLVEGINGAFVGQIKDEYENIIQKIMDECFEADIFKSNSAKKIIEYIRETYDDELEFLWKKSTGNAIARRKDNKKWYLAILTVAKNKLGISSNEIVEIIDLRHNPETLKKLLEEKGYFAGYHMNKKHWITIILDGSVSIDEIYNRIDESYNLAKK